MNNDCLTLESDNEEKRLNISPINPKGDQIFQIDFNQADSTATIKHAKHNVYVSCDTNPTAFSLIRTSRSAQKFKIEPGSKAGQYRFYVKSPYIKLYLWYALSRVPVNPPKAGLIPDNPGVALKNWRLELVDG
ncbi:hypothetical protein FS749_007230 [Ceratobasidium sp. UAMH 11750]|nr:hypothetical protein FS749_007230 [Ceratobasidium sp. UAMH 11750]